MTYSVVLSRKMIIPEPSNKHDLNQKLCLMTFFAYVGHHFLFCPCTCRENMILRVFVAGDYEFLTKLYGLSGASGNES